MTKVENVLITECCLTLMKEIHINYNLHVCLLFIGSVNISRFTLLLWEILVVSGSGD